MAFRSGRLLRRATLGATLTVLGLVPLALAAPKSNPWGRAKQPAPGPARSIGDYSRGCIQGARPLPLDGPGFRVMHPSRLRHFGHPQLVDFVKDLGRSMKHAGQDPLLVGDLAQPRGGRALGGHASHQTGLDADIWYWYPPRRGDKPLSMEDREQWRPRSILNGKTGSIRERWKERVATTLRLAASDERSQRIFVHPIIKRDLCADTEGPRDWLRAIRPWYGHDNHFHVRLFCPEASPDCVAQDAVAPGDGCGEELDWWFDAEAQAERRKQRKRYVRKVVRKAKWPPECNALLPE